MRSRLFFRFNLGVLCLLVSSLAAATPPDGEPARVMMVGMFHFANPGQDLVKTRVIDVTTPENQAYLDGLAARMAAFRPTDVLVECNPAEQAKLDDSFRKYVAGQFELPTNETYQIGFRVAKHAGLSRVSCFDENAIGWNAQPMFDYLDKHEPQEKKALEATFQSLTASMDKEQSTLSLTELLQLANDPARDALNKSLYLRTNGVDAGGGFVGADASSSWWHRNFRMYGNVQKFATAGRRVIVLAGQGHTAILKDLLAADDRRAAEDVRPYLPARELLFADEFNAGQLDRSKWIVIGPDFWVNNEQQAYVDTPEAIRFLPAGRVDGADDGVLALQPNFSKGFKTPNGRTTDFVSGRIESQGKFDFTYGRAVARIKMPDAVGVWPAFWLLGNGAWPETGEIDIMEYVGEADWTGVALHGKGYSGETPLVDKQFFPPGTDVTQWHEYAVEWTPDQILFLVDGRLTYRVTRPMVEHYGKWNFDNPKYLILNFALGGAYPHKTNGIEKPYQGMPEATVEMIKRGEVAMWVDWVRVYGSKPTR